MKTTVDLAVEHMCSWKQLIDRMGNLWDEYQFRFHNKESIKEVLIREIKEILSFSARAVFTCSTFKERKKEIYENLEQLKELNNFVNPEWTEEDATLVDNLETFIYQRWITHTHKKRTDGIPSKVLFLIFPFS